MHVHKMLDMKGGWFIGNFSPAVLKTSEFEVCYKEHKKGEQWETHFHKLGTEYNYLAKGKMVIQGMELNAGDIFILKPNEIADPVFLEDCSVVIVKTPSIPGDKYEVEDA